MPSQVFFRHQKCQGANAKGLEADQQSPGLLKRHRHSGQLAVSGSAEAVTAPDSDGVSTRQPYKDSVIISCLI